MYVDSINFYDKNTSMKLDVQKGLTIELSSALY